MNEERMMNILGRLVESMETSNQQQRSNTNSSMFRSAAPEWAPFNSPIANMAYGGISGHIANKMMGMEWQRQAPLLGGMNSFAANYARQSTGPAIGISNQLIDTHIAGMGGRFAGNVLGTVFGVDDKKAFADKLASEAVNSRALRTLTLMGMQSGAAQAITGGDIIGGSRRMYGATALSGRGEVLNLMKDGRVDYSIGRRHAQRTQETASTFLDRMFEREGGTMGITPNMGFTRGFDTGQIMDMHTLMSERGYRTDSKAVRDDIRRRAEEAREKAAFLPDEDLLDLGVRSSALLDSLKPGKSADDAVRDGIIAANKVYRGSAIDDEGVVSYRDADAETRADMLDKQLNALSALRDVSGESDLGALNEIYNTFAGGKASTVDPDQMAKAFEKMSAMAAVFGKEGKAFTETAMNLQQQLVANAGKLLGGSPTALLDAGGNIMGGMGSIQVATQLSRDAHALATVRNDTSARGIQQAGEEIAAANAVWMGSTQGQDAMLIEWLKQTGEINEEDYNAWDIAMRSGDKRARERAATSVLRRSPFGSAAVARAALGDETFRAGVMAQLGDDEAARLMSRGIGVMDDEIKERTKADAANRAGNQLEALVRGSGGAEANLKEAELAKVKAMASASGEYGAAVMDAYDKGGMSAVGQLMTEAAFDDVGGDMLLAGQKAANAEMVRQLKEEGVESYKMRAGAATMSTKGGVDADTVNEFNNAIAAGDMTTATRLYGKMKSQTSVYGDIVAVSEQNAIDDFNATIKAAELLGKDKSETNRLMTEASGGVPYGMRGLFADNAEGQKQAAAAESIANKMVEAGIIKDQRKEADERRLTFEQRTAEFIGGRGDILAMLGIYKPAEIDEDSELWNELDADEKAEYERQQKAYEQAEKDFGSVDAAELAKMSTDALKKKFGAWFGDAEQLQKQMQAGKLGTTRDMPLAEALTDDELKGVLGSGVEGITEDMSVDDFLNKDTVAGQKIGGDGAVARARDRLKESLAATTEQEKDGKGGGGGDKAYDMTVPTLRVEDNEGNFLYNLVPQAIGKLIELMGG